MEDAGIAGPEGVLRGDLVTQDRLGIRRGAVQEDVGVGVRQAGRDRVRPHATPVDNSHASQQQPSHASGLVTTRCVTVSIQSQSSSTPKPGPIGTCL